MYAAEDDLKISGTFLKIERIVRSRERKLLWWFVDGGIIISSIILSFAFQILDILKKPISLIVAIIALIWLSFLIFNIIKSRSWIPMVSFVNNEERPNFLSRNKDQILVGIIVAIVSILLTKFLKIP
jgi:hypothetical protein